MTDLLAELAPHGGFNIHVSDRDRGPNNEPSVHVVCECGRGYSWELKIPDAELIAWLSNHGPDIPSEEEERRVAEAGGRQAETPFGRLVLLAEDHLRGLREQDFSGPLVDRLRRENCTHDWRAPETFRGYDDAIDCTKCGLRVLDGYRPHYPKKAP